MFRLGAYARKILQAQADPDGTLTPRAKRALVVLLAADGQSVEQIAHRTGYSAPSVRKWCERFKRHGLLGLTEIARPGKKRRTPDDSINCVVKQTIKVRRVFGSTLTTRQLADQCQVSRQMVSRIWKEHNLGVRDREVIGEIRSRTFLVLGMHLGASTRAVILLTTAPLYGSFRYPSSRPGSADEEAIAEITARAQASDIATFLDFLQRADGVIGPVFGVELVLLRIAMQDISPLLNWARPRTRWHVRFHFNRLWWHGGNPEHSLHHLFYWLARSKCRRSMAYSLYHLTTAVQAFCNTARRRTPQEFWWSLDNSF